MNRILGMLVGVGFVAMVVHAYGVSRAGWAADQADVGFWWAVIAGLLAIATVAVFAGTWIHTQPDRR